MSTPIAIAIRNAAILSWWVNCHADFRAYIVRLYAESIGCPTCEVDDKMTGDSDLDWLWANYRATIAEWDEDQY